MNCCVPEFVLEEDESIFPSSFIRKIPDSAVEDFAELVWQNGPVFRRRSPAPIYSDSALPGCTGVSSNSVAETELFMEEDEMANWLDYPVGSADDDSSGVEAFGGDSLLEETPAVSALDLGFHVPKSVGWWAASGRPPLPPETQEKLALVPRANEPAEAAATLPPPASGESTVVGSSVTPGRLGRAWAPESRVSSGGVRGGAGSLEHGLTSSSGVVGEGEGAAKAAACPDDRKRKARDGDDSDSHSEDADFEFSDKKEEIRRPTSKRGSRAAEVHNLSERKRRDRINEKMKALQQLIPRCNKSDKASMLDDAIEYLKSLQMQVQMMSMGCNMFPMMFPGVQQYMPPMGMAVPMGVNMGMGLGMGMEMSAGTLNHPMMPFLPVMSGSHMVPTGAASLSQRLPMQPFHAQALAFSDQIKLQATSQTDQAANPACLPTPNSAQIIDPCQRQYAGFHHPQVHPQNQAVIEQGTSRRTNMPEKSRIG